jgi:hypothetical protein
MEQTSNYLSLIILRFFSGLGGLALIAMAIFLYETEDKKIQSHLEDWWVQLDDMADQIYLRLMSFLCTAVRLWIRSLDVLFGPRILSVQAVAVSSCLSWSSVLLVLALFLLSPSVETSELAPYVGIVFSRAICWLLIFMVLSLLPMVFRNSPRARKILCIMGLVASLVGMAYFALLISFILLDASAGNILVMLFYPKELFTSFITCALTGILSNLFLLAANRWILLVSLKRVTSFQSRRSSIRSSLLWLSVGCFISISLVTMGVIFPLRYWASSLHKGQGSFFAGGFQLIVGLMNIPISLAFIAFILIVLLMLAHNTVWPLPTRLLYFVVRHRLIEKKWTLWMAGISMLALAVPSMGELAKHLEKSLGLG